MVSKDERQSPDDDRTTVAPDSGNKRSVTPIDVYRETDKLPDDVLDVMADRLEGRASHPRFIEMRRHYLDAMEIDKNQSVLVIGSGTGVIPRAIARRPAFNGIVTGIDISPRLVEIAARIANEEGVGNRVAFQVGDARNLSFPNESFDAVVAHTLFSHLEDPLTVLREAARVTRPGGMLGIFDGDFASMSFSHEDPNLGKIYDEAIQRSMITNPRIMRRMPALLRIAGLELVAAFPFIFAEVGKADFWAAGIQGYRTIVPKAGTLSQSEIDNWADARLDESASGTFFGACTYYAYLVRRP